MLRGFHLPKKRNEKKNEKSHKTRHIRDYKREWEGRNKQKKVRE